MEAHIAPVTASLSHGSFDTFAEALGVVNANDARLFGGFAYATFGGVNELLSHAETNESWIPLSKRFIIGIHQGITEPSALELLRELPRAKVRIFIPGGRLTPKALVAQPLFHPKVIAITNERTDKLTFLQAGSANLTSSALSDVPRNYEFSISVAAARSTLPDWTKEFGDWWSHIWNQSRVVDRRLIRRYADVRMSVLEQNPILKMEAGPPSHMQVAERFFVEVGAASGPPGLRHQVEFPEWLAAFFGKPKRHRRNLTLSNDVATWNARPLSHKVTTFGVEIWRLGMPTQRRGGDPIAHRAIRFKRTDDPDTFHFQVADTQSATFLGWKKAANMSGQFGSTHGQQPRMYGFY